MHPRLRMYVVDQSYLIGRQIDCLLYTTRQLAMLVV